MAYIYLVLDYQYMGYSCYIYLHSYGVPKFLVKVFVSIWKTDGTCCYVTPSHQIYILKSGWPAEVFQAWQLIPLVVFGAVDEPHTSCVGKLEIVKRNFLLIVRHYNMMVGAL